MQDQFWLQDMARNFDILALGGDLGTVRIINMVNARSTKLAMDSMAAVIGGLSHLIVASLQKMRRHSWFVLALVPSLSNCRLLKRDKGCALSHSC